MKKLKINYCLFLTALLLAYPMGALSDDRDADHEIGSLSGAQQQAIWQSEAYRFLNGGNYPYYVPYYTPYNAPYAFPTQPYPVPAPGYAVAPQASVAAPTQAYASLGGYTIMSATNSSIGSYLTDGQGRTLYHLQSDQGSYTSKCTDATCTGIWPPFYSASINVPGNLNPADFRNIIVNGYKQYQQTTFRGWPLYYFYRDTKPGDIYGQGLRDSYGVWSVVSLDSPSTFPINFPYLSGGAVAA